MGGLFSVVAIRCPPRAAPASFSDRQRRGEETQLSIDGYDPVAYFTDGKPVAGVSRVRICLARYTLALCQRRPSRPLYRRTPSTTRRNTTGIARWGSAWQQPHKDTVDPNAWTIVDGKLYLTHTPRALEAWQKNAAENIKRADVNWSTVRTSSRTRDRRTAMSQSAALGRDLVQGRRTATPRRRAGRLSTRAAISSARATCGRRLSRSPKTSRRALRPPGQNRPMSFGRGPIVTDADAFSKNADMLSRYLGQETKTSSTAAVVTDGGPGFPR